MWCVWVEDGVLAAKHDCRGLKAQKVYFFIDTLYGLPELNNNQWEGSLLPVNQAFGGAPGLFGLMRSAHHQYAESSDLIADYIT